MAGNKKISQLVDGGAGQAGDNFVIERGGVNFKVDNSSISGNPGGLLLNGIVNDMIVKDEKSEVALEQRLTLPPALSFVDNTALPPTEADTDIYLLDDTGATNAAWDGAAQNSWVRFDGLAGLWKEIGALDGFICTLIDTGFVRILDPTTGAWELFGVASPAGANTQIQFNNAGAFGASSLFTFDTGFGVFSCDAAAIFNDGGTDQDFRIEGLSDTSLFFVDAGQDSVGIGKTPAADDKFAVSTTAESDAFTIEDDTGNVILSPETAVVGYRLDIGVDGTNAERGFRIALNAAVTPTNDAFQLRYDGSVIYQIRMRGDHGIGTGSDGVHALLVDAKSLAANATFSGAGGLKTIGNGTGSGSNSFQAMDGAATPLSIFRASNQGYSIMRAIDAAIADGGLSTSEMSFYLDEAGDTFTIKAKYSDNTVKTGTVALA